MNKLVGKVLTRNRPMLRTFGHSWVAGRYPDRLIRPWPRRVADALNMPVRNYGAGSSESPEVFARIGKYEPIEGDVVVIEPLLNDVRRYGKQSCGLARYEAALTAMLRHLGACGFPVRTLILLDPEIVAWEAHPPHDQGSASALKIYGDLTRVVVAGGFDAAVVDLSPGWNAAMHIIADGVHPNEPGTALIAERVIAAIGLAGDRQAIL
jgi:lysophospholipase L1-like esterase